MRHYSACRKRHWTHCSNLKKHIQKPDENTTSDGFAVHRAVQGSDRFFRRGRLCIHTKIHAESVRRTMPPPQKWKQYLDFIYSHIFLKIMRTSDLWKSDQAHRNDSFDITIHACLWHTACIQHGCAVFFATLTT